MSKNSIIRMGSDGFSYHTIELKLKMMPDRYEKLLSKLYSTGTVHKLNYDSCRSHNCRIFQDHGINLYLTRTKKGYCVIKAVVNPRRVLDPESGYLGIMPSNIKKQKKFEMKFYELMLEVGLPGIEEWKLTRVDLCVNLECELKKTASEILRLLDKAILPPNMKRERFEKKDAGKDERREQREKDKHSVRVLINEGIGLTVYDKLFQMASENLPVDLKKKYKGILRVEMHCRKDFIRYIQREYNIMDNSHLLSFLASKSPEYIVTAVKDAFGCDPFMKAEITKKLIYESSCQAETKKQLLWLVDCLRYPFELKKLEEKMKKEFDISPRVVQNRIEMLHRLHIDPIPLRSDFYLDRMPSLAKLLLSFAGGERKIFLLNREEISG